MAAVRRALAAGLRDRRLGRRVAVAVGSLGGDGPTYSSGPDPFVPASTLKLLTGTAALATLGPDHRFSTRVVQGPGNRIVLVGGGDPYLASKPVPADELDATFPARADVRTLATDVARSLTDAGKKRVRIAYDATLFTGEDVNGTWEPGYVPDGVVSPVSALWVDEGRDPSGYGRVSDPAAQAAAEFARGAEVAGPRRRGRPVAGVAGPGGDVLGEVASAPVSDIVERVIAVSDNDGAEVLARHVGLAAVQDGSFVGGVRGTRLTLQDLGSPWATTRVRRLRTLARQPAQRADPAVGAAYGRRR